MPGYFERRPALRPLARRDFRLLLGGAAILGVLMPLHLLTQVFWVSERYPERAVLYTSIIAAAKGAGMVAFSLIGGAIADRADRRRVLLVCEVLSLGAHGVIALLMLTEPAGEGSVALVAAATLVASGIQSVDSPARSASLPVAAGRENLAAAIALLSISNQVTMPISLPLAGLLNEVMAPGAVYASTLLAWVAILPLIAMLRFRSTGGAARTPVLASVWEGLTYVWTMGPILAVLATVVVIQVLGMPVATPLGPMFSIEVLGLTPLEVGLLGGTWGLGSFTASILLARMRHLSRKGASLAILTALFGICILAFGYSRIIVLTAIADYGMGLAFTGSMLVASTLTQHLVSDSMRGRVLSLFPLAMGLAQVSTALSGLAGQWLGLAVLLPLLGWAVLGCLAALLLTWRRYVGATAPSLTDPAAA